MINKNTFLLAALILPGVTLPAANSPSSSNESPLSQEFAYLEIPYDNESYGAFTPHMPELEELFNTCLETQDPHDINALTDHLGSTQTIYRKYEHSLLIEAIRTGKLTVAKAIIQKCPHYCAAKRACYDEDGQHPLHLLVGGETPYKDPLLHKCIDLLAPYVNLLDTTGETPLMSAYHPVIAAHLIALGAKVRALSDNNCTALSSHIAFTNKKMVKFLRPLDTSIALPEKLELLIESAQDTAVYSQSAAECNAHAARENVLNWLISQLAAPDSDQSDQIDLTRLTTPREVPASYQIELGAIYNDINNAPEVIRNLPRVISFNRSYESMIAAKEVAALMQAPITLEEHSKAQIRVDRYKKRTPKYLSQREVDPRGAKRSRRR